MRSFIFLISLFSIQLLAAQDNVLKLASDTWPPFTNQENKRSVAMDIVREALSRNSIETAYTITTFNEVLKGIKKEDFAGSAALWKNNEREKYLLFSKPYLKNKLILVGKKGSDVSMTSLKELKGKSVALVSNYAYGKKEAAGVNIVEGKNDQENLKKLLADSVDYMLVDALLIEYLLTYQKDETAQYLEIGTNTILEKDLYFAIRKDVKDAAEIIEKFNASIDEMMVDGTYNLILQLNWIQVDIDGDGTMEYVPQNTASLSKPIHTYTIMKDSASPNGGYYIEGVKYDTWEEVPAKYKAAENTEVTPEQQKMDVFDF